MKKQTIVAIATASGQGSINILRVSGSEAISSVEKIFSKNISDAKSHTIHYGYIKKDNNIIDEVLVLLMRAPHSYTREDVVEIHCHGGGYIANRILNILIEDEVRLAEPGEFTKRAYLNGRLDLTQAESVMDIIRAQSDVALNSAENHLQGDIKQKITRLRELIISDTALLEAALDDPEHIELNNYETTLTNHLDNIEKVLDDMIQKTENGRIISEGVRTAIVGCPNVGKSSLLNCLLRQDRAIVTDIPGTTRDTLEENLRIGSVFLHLIDTAGIRETDDKIEKIGVERSQKSIDESDFVICVLDSSRQPTKDDYNILSYCENKPGIIVLNKSDLPTATSTDDIIKQNISTKKIIKISSKTGDGLDIIEKEIEDIIITEFFSKNQDYKNEIYITNNRQKEALLDAKKAFEHLRETINQKMPVDLLTVDLMDAYESLGRITGQSLEDDLADKIFSDFCMGK